MPLRSGPTWNLRVSKLVCGGGGESGLVRPGKCCFFKILQLQKHQVASIPYNGRDDLVTHQAWRIVVISCGGCENKAKHDVWQFLLHAGKMETEEEEYLAQPWKPVPEGMEWPSRKLLQVRNSAIHPGRKSNGRGQVVQRQYFIWCLVFFADRWHS